MQLHMAQEQDLQVVAGSNTTKLINFKYIFT